MTKSLSGRKIRTLQRLLLGAACLAFFPNFKLRSAASLKVLLLEERSKTLTSLYFSWELSKVIDALRYWFGKVVKLEFEVHTYFFCFWKERNTAAGQERRKGFLFFFTHQGLKGENLINKSLLLLLFVPRLLPLLFPSVRKQGAI